ncbi:MMPL family transporter [soil metagenome]
MRRLTLVGVGIEEVAFRCRRHIWQASPVSPTRAKHRPPHQPALQRLGRSTAAHPWRYVATWAVLVILSFAASLGVLTGESVFDRLTSGTTEAPGEAQDAYDLLASENEEALTVLVAVKGADVLAPETAASVGQTVQDLSAIPDVSEVSSPMTTPGWPQEQAAYGLVADADPESGGFMVVVSMPGELSTADQRDVVDQVKEIAPPGLEDVSQDVTVGGITQLIDDINDLVKADLTKGEGFALPASLLVMVVVFGGVLAAGMPIVGAIASIGGGLGILLGFSYLMDLDATVVNIVTVMGLALCIDYGLLMVSRFREEVVAVAPGVAHRDLTPAQVEAAVVGAVSTAGRTVLFSALIVGISLSGLTLFEAPIMRAIGAAGVSVVVVAFVVALTLIPALCALAARRLGKRRGAELSGDEGWFSSLARVVQRRPAITVLVSVAMLLTLAAPVLGMRLTSSGVQLLPVGAEQRTFFETLDADYPALAGADVTVVADGNIAEVQAWVDGAIEPLPGVDSIDPVQAEGDLAVVRIATEGSATDDAARDVVDALRGDRPDFEIWVTGQAASLADFVDAMIDRAPYAAAWIAGATFILLFLLTASVVIPTKALILNVVSLGASLGLTTWVFQGPHFEGLLDFTSAGGVESIIPLLVLAFGFGLSMDYEVFLLARIIELHEAGLSDNEAVRLGLQRSGRIITSAALIMVIVFSGFAFGDMLAIKQTGFALATAVFIDATLVRMVLVPSTMTLLGKWNWWAPGFLKPVHDRFGVTEHAGANAPKDPAESAQLAAVGIGRRTP